MCKSRDDHTARDIVTFEEYAADQRDEPSSGATGRDTWHYSIP